MKIVIASDIHGSYRYAKKLMEAYQREGSMSSSVGETKN